MSKKKSTVNTERRDFLKVISHAGLSMGVLRGCSLATGMMLGRTAVAAQATSINKVVFVYIGGGSPFLNGKSLFNPSSDLVLPAASAPLESVKNEIVFFSDVSVTGGGGHGYTQKTLGATKNKNTIDVSLSDTLGANSAFPLLLLGVQSNNGNHGFATQRDHREIAYQDNPIATFNRVFGGASGGGSNNASIDTLRSQSVLDIQKAEIAALQAVLGSEEKERLDTHLASIERIEQRLRAQSTGGTNSNPGAGFNPNNFVYDSSDTSTFTKVSDLQMDLAVLSLKSNQTRVASIMLGNHQSDHSVPELDWSDTYHQSIHGAGEQGVGPHTETRAYLSSRLAYLIEELKAAKDDAGNSLLDSTLVVQVTDMGEGNNHTSDNAPMLLAGGGSAVKRGQLAQCGQHVNIFDTVSELVGVTGDVPKYGSGALTGIIV